MSEPIEITEITETNDRGFHRYGEPLVCDYGNTATVYESSSAEAPHVWLNISSTGQIKPRMGTAALHLNEEQARALIARLNAWLEEIPERWGASDEPALFAHLNCSLK